MYRVAICITALSCFALPVPAKGQNADAKKASVNLPLRGMVKPLDQAAVATDLQARVAAVHFREGERFAKNDPLISFDCERQQAEHDAAVAQQREMKAAHESSVFLDRRGATGKLDVEVAKARLDKATAEVSGQKARLKLCIIRAPFDGRITERLINAFEFPTAGKPLISVVDETAFEIELIVPSSSLKTMTVGSPIRFAVDELSETFDARVARIGAAVDPVSQTVKVVALFVSRPARVISGMSGSALF